jgi:hypothetical protein
MSFLVVIAGWHHNTLLYQLSYGGYVPPEGLEPSTYGLKGCRIAVRCLYHVYVWRFGFKLFLVCIYFVLTYNWREMACELGGVW